MSHCLALGVHDAYKAGKREFPAYQPRSDLVGVADVSRPHLPAQKRQRKLKVTVKHSIPRKDLRCPSEYQLAQEPLSILQGHLTQSTTLRLNPAKLKPGLPQESPVVPSISSQEQGLLSLSWRLILDECHTAKSKGPYRPSTQNTSSGWGQDSVRTCYIKCENLSSIPRIQKTRCVPVCVCMCTHVCAHVHLCAYICIPAFLWEQESRSRQEKPLRLMGHLALREQK